LTVGQLSQGPQVGRKNLASFGFVPIESSRRPHQGSSQWSEACASARKCSREPLKDLHRSGDRIGQMRNRAHRFPKALAVSAVIAAVLVLSVASYVAQSSSRASAANRGRASSDVRFAPAAGWSQTSTGMHPQPPQVPSVTVATTPIEDPPGALPTETLRDLPAAGVVILVAAYDRLPECAGTNFPKRSLPL
jgi:hypothetical protein